MAGLVELRVKKKDRPHLITIKDLAWHLLRVQSSPLLILLCFPYSQKAEPWPSGVSDGTLAGSMCAGAKGVTWGVVIGESLIDELFTGDSYFGLNSTRSTFL